MVLQYHGSMSTFWESMIFPRSDCGIRSALSPQNCWTKQVPISGVKRRQRAFKITGLTWIVERSFAWLGRNRRLSKDYEYSVQTSETLIDIAATRLILNRLASA
jgi:transposase